MIPRESKEVFDADIAGWKLEPCSICYHVFNPSQLHENTCSSCIVDLSEKQRPRPMRIELSVLQWMMMEERDRRRLRGVIIELGLSYYLDEKDNVIVFFKA